jgi:hypothetical protein
LVTASDEFPGEPVDVYLDAAERGRRQAIGNQQDLQDVIVP